MTTIISQDKSRIVNVEAIDHIFTDGEAVVAVTPACEEISLGLYKGKNIEKVMTYLAFSMTSPGKTIIMPTNETVSNDRQIAADFIAKTVSEMQSKKGGDAPTVSISPEAEAMLRKMFGDKEGGK